MSTENISNQNQASTAAIVVPTVSKKAEKKSGSGVVTTALLLPMSVIFLAIALSSSLIISATILSRSIKDAGGIKDNSSTASSFTTVTTTAAPTATAAVTLDTMKTVFKGDHIKFGNENSKVLFVEFSDPSCPYCHIAGGKDPELSKSAGASFQYDTDGGTYIPPMREVKKLVDAGKISYAWIYNNGHGNGEMGTRALYCANEKGKFWEAHDLLMSYSGYNLLNNTIKNDKTQSASLADFLKLAVDANEMKSCIDSGKYDSRLTSDMALAKTFGSSGTPGFYINTTNFAGAYSYSDMKPVIDAALNS